MTPADEFQINDDDVEVRFIRAGGPGGQNVNKLATAAQLRFDVNGSSLPPDVKERLKGIAGSRMTRDGILVITARRHRTQEDNRADAIERLKVLIRSALHRPAKRKKTRVTKASKERRLKSKKERSGVKAMRRKSGNED